MYCPRDAKKKARKMQTAKMPTAMSASEKKRTSKYFFTSALLKTACLLQLLLQTLHLKTYAACIE
jgi:hypothetical protein